ncbi:MAG: LysR family transcriptional regulator [Ruminococcus sp.]|nr:LysR family transcriptional regulator [Ruminococcus sp.]
MNNKYLRAKDVAEILDVSVSYAYKVISKFNKELEDKGFFTCSGRINREYFNERLYKSEKESDFNGSL